MLVHSQQWTEISQQWTEGSHKEGEVTLFKGISYFLDIAVLFLTLKVLDMIAFQRILNFVQLV